VAFSFQETDMLDPQLISIAQQAWEAVKDSSQPSWNECQARHRQMCLTAAKAVLKTGHAQTPFELKVRELQTQTPPAVAHEPLTASEELQHFTALGDAKRSINVPSEQAAEINYALPHSQFIAERNDRLGLTPEPEIDIAEAAAIARASGPVEEKEAAEVKPALKHGDVELAEAAGVKVDQHETKGAAKVGESPAPKKASKKSSKGDVKTKEK
jgi:hypothetical protein